jgi:dipeptidyl aminopeptidase/acylaminoacyl peptidase
MHDTLCGVEMLIRNGAVDRDRIAVMGGSHGGYMAAWMVTQCDLFAAAVALAPVTDCFSCDFTSSDSEFYRLFLASDPFDRDGKHFSRSPIMFARNVTTPTLLVAGGRDRCTPASQAVEFHRALVERGVPSELVVYPNEGHGVRQLEAYIDYCTRVVDWIGTHGSKKAFAITQELVSDSATDQCGHREAEPAR